MDKRMPTSKSFLQASGAAGIIAGLTTFAIVLLPQFYPSAGTLAERAALLENPFYHARQWCSFLNVFAILLAGWGLAAHRLKDSPGAASTGMLFLLFYGVAELLGRSAMIFGREYGWMAELATAEAARRADLLLLIEAFDGIWAGWFVLILICFTASAALFGWATRGGSTLQRATSFMLFAAALLGAMTLFSRVLPALAVPSIWGYPLIQPTSRLLIGLFLLSEARALVSRPTEVSPQ